MVRRYTVRPEVDQIACLASVFVGHMSKELPGKMEGEKEGEGEG